MKEYTIKANGKINLAIDVRKRLDNGYHEIDMVTVPLELHDTINISYLKDNTAETYLFCNDEKIPCDESNLVYKAYKLLKEKDDFSEKLKIFIYKRIPVEAGLGGGSSDAAAILMNLPAILKKKNDIDIYSLAPIIGSDVSFFLNNRPARVLSTGDKLEDITIKDSYYVLIVKPKVGLSTKLVYALYDEMEEDIKRPNIQELIEGLKTGDEEKIQANMINVLTKPATNRVPIINDILYDMKMMNLPLSNMSGTGSACFALSKDKNYLKKVSEVFEKKGHKVFLTQFKLNS